MFADFHTHILPRVDDGSASLEETLEMLRMEGQQGVKTVVATPHFYANHDQPERFLRRRQSAYSHLLVAMEGKAELPQVVLGAEVYYFAGMSNSDALEYLTIGEKKYIMLEMPFDQWSDSMYREIEAIYTKQGITPIIAHVDRYITPLRSFGIPERLQDMPVLVQANASFFTKASTRRMAIRMLRRGQIHLIGSDCHNLTSRKPNLFAAYEIIGKYLGESCIAMVNQYESRVLSDCMVRIKL
jgi:protein-tyrosine phosphatase